MDWYTDKRTDGQILTDTDRVTDSSPQIFNAPETNALDLNGLRGCMLYRVRLPFFSYHHKSQCNAEAILTQEVKLKFNTNLFATL